MQNTTNNTKVRWDLINWNSGEQCASVQSKIDREQKIFQNIVNKEDKKPFWMNYASKQASQKECSPKRL